MQTEPPLPLTTAYIAAGACSAAAGLYTILDLEPAPLVALIVQIAPLIAVLIWLQEDARRTKAVAVHDWGFFLWVAWPILLPWYALNTRGRRGAFLALGLGALALAPFLTALLLAVLLYRE